MDTRPTTALPTLSQRAQTHQASRIRELLRLTEQPHMMSLAGGLPAPDGFPDGLIRQAFDRAMGHVGVTGATALQYSPTEGLTALRELVAADHVVPIEEVLVTTGSQQALDLLARVLCDPGDVIVAEDPSYLGALQAFRFAGASVVGVEGDGDGIDVDGVDAALALAGGRAKAIYVVPNFHNPSGAVLSAARRVQLIDVAQRHGVVVIEDDPYGEIRFAGTPLTPLARLGAETGAGVVRLGSSSKVLAPGLRVGWMSGPTSIVAAAVRAKQAADLHTSSLNQLIVAEALADATAFGDHLDRARSLYGARAAALAEALRSHLGDQVSFSAPEGGMFLWCTLAGVDTEALLLAAVEEGVAFVPGSAFAIDAATGPTHADRARLSFATLRPEQFDEAARRLARALLAAVR
jgi:2-aminoadipate transaminase